MITIEIELLTMFLLQELEDESEREYQAFLADNKDRLDALDRECTRYKNGDHPENILHRAQFYRDRRVRMLIKYPKLK